ncbi:hypothetical protein A0256_23235 [Mucilaginibacter sp. PAMC 26640]|nr:hypothetical protein A0256_23235 [Mucilaginibacter sp. PAMC 26640]
MDEQNRRIRPSEAVEILGVSVNQLRTLRDNGSLGYVKFNKAYRYRLDEVLKLKINLMADQFADQVTLPP